VLATIPPQTVGEGSVLTFAASATDTDFPANVLSYSLVDAPAGASMDPVTGVFSWTPTEMQGPGIFNFVVRVSDGTLAAEQAVTVLVEEVFPSSEVDSDSDGLVDLLEFAFGSDPAVPNSNPFRMVGSGEDTVSLEFPWNWQASGMGWRILHGQDLANVSGWLEVAPETVVTVREGNIDRITIDCAKADLDRGFYILEVTVD
jgi:hypothetical protein